MKKNRKNKINNRTVIKDSEANLEDNNSSKETTRNSKINLDVEENSKLPEKIDDSGINIGSLTSEISQLKLEIQREVDRKLRLMAEYDNYRKRTQSEYQRIYDTAAERIILKLLPVIDDLQRFIDQEINSTYPIVMKQGIEMIYKKLMDTIASENVKPIESIGNEFNVDLHEAIAQIEDESKPDGIILTEVERGYTLGTRVIRHPKVVVNSYSTTEVTSNNE